MKISKEWQMMEMAGDYVAVSCQTEEDDFRGIVRLIETGKTIWDGLSAGKTEEEIANQMVGEYSNLSLERALKDVRKVVQILRAEGLLEG